MRRPAGVLCRALLFDSFVKGYFVLAYTNQYPYPASSTSRRSLSLIYRDRLAISYHDHAQYVRQGHLQNDVAAEYPLDDRMPRHDPDESSRNARFHSGTRLSARLTSDRDLWYVDSPSIRCLIQRRSD